MDPQVPGRIFLGRGADQADHTVFGGGIGILTLQTDRAVDRARVDDRAAPSRKDRGNLILHSVEDAMKIDFAHVFPLLPAHLFELGKSPGYTAIIYPKR